MTDQHRDRIAAAVGKALDDDPMHTLTDLQQRITTSVLAELKPELDALTRARALHRETCPLARGDVQPPAFTCSMCDTLTPPGATQATEQDTTTRVFAALHRSAEETVTRTINLYERWVNAGPPPLGTSMARWWDKKLIELHHAIQPPAATQATDGPKEQP